MTMKKNKSFLLTLILSILITPFMFSQWNEMDKIVANDRQPGDYFSGSSFPSQGGVNIYNDIAVVGAPMDDHSPLLTDAGSVYIYRKNANCDWILVQKITASIPSPGDYFGWSAAIYGDFIVVGARNNDTDENNSNTINDAGAAYIFQNISGTWTQIQKIVSGDRETSGGFGSDVDITANRIIVGSWFEDSGPGVPNIMNSGAAYVFEYNGITWSQFQKLVPNDRGVDDQFGFSVAISNDYAIVGALREQEDVTGVSGTLLYAGSAYIYERNVTWNQVQKVTSTDRGSGEFFGSTVDIDGTFAIIGVFQDSEDENGLTPLSAAGSAFIFERNLSGVWVVGAKIVASDRASGDHFGYSVAISSMGNAVVGARYEAQDATGVSGTLPYAGSAYIYSNSGGPWSQTKKLYLVTGLQTTDLVKPYPFITT